MSKSHELVQEFRAVFAGRGSLVDAILPPLVFVLLNAWLDFEVAVWVSLGVALLILGFRVLRRQSVRYAFGSIGGVLLASLLALLLDRAEGYFLPSIVSGAGTILLCLVSVIAGRPLVAWTSHVARRWPLAWYWHPRIRPAYNEVTLAWAVFFAMRLTLQLLLLQAQSTEALVVASLVMGWPATIALLVASYLYGSWRLRQLGGPSVKEFEAGTEPPWGGQQRGF